VKKYFGLTNVLGCWGGKLFYPKQQPISGLELELELEPELELELELEPMPALSPLELGLNGPKPASRVCLSNSLTGSKASPSLVPETLPVSRTWRLRGL